MIVGLHNTSITYPLCGDIDKRNRLSRGRFKCISGGFAGPADVVAAGNVARLASAQWPYAALWGGFADCHPVWCTDKEGVKCAGRIGNVLQKKWS